MWLDNINRKIELIIELARPDKKGELNKLLKEIRDDRIQFKTLDVKILLDFYIENSSYEKNEGTFDILRKLGNLKENNDFDEKIQYILNFFHPETRDVVEILVKDLIVETDNQTMFEFKKGMSSLIAQIEKFVDHPIKDE